MSGFVVQGRGGGKGGGGSASEEKDSLRSTQIAEIIDVISEGECEGLVGGAKGVYLDGVPLQNDDDSFNFSGVQLAWTPGTQGQAALPGVSAVQSEVGVNVAVTKAAPVVRTIASTSVDKCRVTIAVPRLTFQDPSSGDIKGTSFEWAIDVQSSGGGYVEVYSGKVEGKTNSSYTKSVEFDLPGAAPWDVRLRRITDDATTSNINNAFNWFSYTAIQSVKLRYPNTAYTYLRIDAEQFSNVPDRTFKWRGVRIRVPTNYDPVARSYSGTWDGTFKIAYSNNPAWVFFDMVTHERYGLGEYIDVSQVNKWALYAIGQYCDEMVPDGYGGVEPRFTINVQLRDRVEAYKLMQDLSSVFRGMAYWSGSSLEVFQDAPEDASLLYTPANVVDGNFSYEDTSEKSLHSVFICYWHDMAQAAKKVPEVYAPNDLIQRYGVREIEMTPMGVTSRGMAARLCRWARHSEQMEGGQVGFTVGSDGVVATPGKVFAVADPNVAGERLAGRIIAATSSSIGLDAPVNLASGEIYTVTVLKPSSADHMQYETEERTITTSAGADITSISVSPSFTFTPVVGTIWMIQSTTIAPTLWRCLGVNELSGKNQYAITGVAHNPSKFASIEYGLTLDTPIITRIKTAATPPSSLALVEEIYTDGTVNKSALTISFVPAKDSRRHKISYRQDTGWWVDLPDTSEQSVTIRGLDPGVYDVVVRSVNGLGNVSQAVQDTITLAGGRSGIRQVRLKASSMTFKVPSSGSASPSTIAITADTGALDESGLTWSVTGATLTGSGHTRSLAFANMSADVCMVTATVSDGGSTFSDTITIIKVYDGMPGSDGSDGAPGEPGTTGADGAPAVSASMTLDSIGLPADATGAVTSYTGASSSMVVFMGGAVDTTNWSFSHVASGVTVTRSTNTVKVTAMSAGTEIGYVDVTATRSGYASITKRVTVSKYKTGATGATGANATAYWLVTSAPAVQKSVAGVYTPAAVTYSVKSASGSAAPAAYAGRFIIATSTDGTTYTDQYTSAANESSKAYTIPANIKTVRVRAYLAGGTATLLDELITTVVSDGATGATGASAVSSVLSNEAHVLPAASDGTVSSYTGSGTEVRVFEGATELAYDGVGTSNGTWKVTTTPTNITVGTLTDSGTYLTVGAHSGVAAGTDTASIVYTITGKTASGSSFTITKSQSFSKSKAGATGAQGATGATGSSATAYWLQTSAPAIQKTIAGVYTPASVTYSLMSATGASAPAAYAGRFIIATSTDGSVYTDQYTSTANESSKAYTVPAGIKTIRVRAYLAGGATTLLDELITTVVSDGATGATGSTGATGPTGPSGASAITAVLSNEAHVLPAASDGTVSSYTGSGTEVRVYEGATELAYDGVGTSNGTWKVTAAATNITVGTLTDSGTYLTVGAHSAVAAGTDTSSIVYTITGKTAAGVAFTITKNQTFTKSKAGATGATGATGAAGANATAYWMTSSAPAVLKSVAGAFTPASVTVALYSATGSSAPVAYAGRFIIATSADGSTFSDAYTSASNEASKTFTVPGGIKAIRFRAYAAGGTTTLLDEEITTVVSDGVSAVAATCSNEAHTLAANTDGTVTSYVGSGCEIRVSEGATELAYDGSGVTNGTWKVSLTASNITPGALTDSGTYLTVGAHSGVAAATDVASITYTITGKTSAGAPFTIVKQQSFSKSKAGRRGSVQLAASTTGTTWSDSVATAAVVAAGYTEPVDRDVVTLVNASAKWSEARAYASGSWLTIAAYISGNMMVDGTVLAQHLNVTSLSAITGNMGSLTAGSITLDASGFIRAGQTAYNTGSGFWVGYSGGAYKFSLGSQTQGITWDGSTLTMSGNLNAAGGTFAGTLTAAAVNAVNTVNIAGDALYVTLSSEWSGNVTITSAAPGRYAYTANGFYGTSAEGVSPKVAVLMSFQLKTSVTASFTIYVERDGVVIGSFSATAGGTSEVFRITRQYADSPGSGTHSYNIYATCSSGNVSLTYCSLLCIGSKK